jgi:uncharacterized protein (TIGR02284 family)
MQTNREADIRVLNSLIETTVDSINGYRDSAEHTDDADLKAMFRTRAGEREKVASELRAKVRELGGQPEDEGTMLAKAHRAFLDLKSMIGSDRKRVIEEVERGEDHIKDKFEAAMRSTEISPDTQAVIRTCYGSVKAGHDEVSAMKHAQQR